MKVILLATFVPAPGTATINRSSPVVWLVAPYVPITSGISTTGARFDKSGMLIGSMVRDEIHQQFEDSFVSL